MLKKSNTTTSTASMINAMNIADTPNISNNNNMDHKFKIDDEFLSISHTEPYRFMKHNPHNSADPSASKVYMSGKFKKLINEINDDFEAAYPGHGHPLPAILIRGGPGAPRVLVPDSELDAMTELSELIARVAELLEIERLRGPALKVVA